MNRPLTEVFSNRKVVNGSKIYQSETSHRYVLGLYELMDRLTEKFPSLMIENCAAGGGRFDPGTVQ